MIFGALLVIVAGFALYIFVLREPRYQGRTVSKWLDDLDYGLKAGLQAETAIKVIGKPGVPAIVRYLHRRDSALRKFTHDKIDSNFRYTTREIYRKRALRALSALGPDAAETVPDLARSFYRNESPIDFADALAAIGGEGIKVLIHGLSHTNTAVRGAAAWRLGDARDRAREAVPALINALGDTDVSVRQGAAWSLGRIALHPEIAVPALAARLSDTNWYVRLDLLLAIRAFGTNAEAAIPQLRYALETTNIPQRVYAASTLRAVSPSAASEAGVSTSNILQMLSNADEEGKRFAANVLFLDQECPPDAVPVLIGRLNDTNPKIRGIAIVILGNYGTKALSALPHLKERFMDPDQYVRSMATDTVSRIQTAMTGVTNN